MSSLDAATAPSTFASSVRRAPQQPFFTVLLKIEDDGKTSCAIPPRNVLRTPATRKGNGTTLESTLSARPHKQRRCRFDTCSNFSSHSTWIFTSMLVRLGGALGLTWPHTFCGSFHPEFRGLPQQVMARWMMSSIHGVSEVIPGDYNPHDTTPRLLAFGIKEIKTTFIWPL